MATISLEERMVVLEAEVARLKQQIAARRPLNWSSLVGAAVRGVQRRSHF